MKLIIILKAKQKIKHQIWLSPEFVWVWKLEKDREFGFVNLVDAVNVIVISIVFYL